MHRETIHIVQAHVAGRGKNLKAEPPIGCKGAAEAARKAGRLAPVREDVIACNVSADAKMGHHGENPAMLFKLGPPPPPWDEV